MKRRDFLKTSAIAAVGTTAIASSAFGSNVNKNKPIKIKLATTWPANLPILATGVDDFAKKLKIISGGSIDVKVYPADSLVPAMAVFDATSAGQIDAYSGAAYYFKGKNEAFSLFTGFPFGMSAIEMNSWLDFGGGMELYRQMYAKYNLIPFKGGNTDMQMGGWFRKEIKNLADLKGLKMRIPGLGGEVLAKLGASPTLMPAGEIYVALERGTIDATEWIGPAHDIKMGFNKVAKYYYTGWHEPGSLLEFVFNSKKHDEMSDEQKLMIEVVANEVSTKITSEFNHESAKALTEIQKAGGVEIKTFSKDITDAAKKAMAEVAAEKSSASADFKKVWESAHSYLEFNKPWTKMGIEAYLGVR